MIIKLDKNKHPETSSLTIQMLGAQRTFLHAQQQKGDSPPFSLE